VNTGTPYASRHEDVAKAIEAGWKFESTRLIAAIAGVTHDLGIGEEQAQER
jgi:RNA polymerase sigma-70 factor, ECF subfamily